MGFLRIMAGPVFGVAVLVTVYLLNQWLEFAPGGGFYGGDSYEEDWEYGDELYEDYPGGAYESVPYDELGYEENGYGHEMPDEGYALETAAEPAIPESVDVRSMLASLDSDIEEQGGEIVAVYVYGRVTDAHLERISELPALETLYLANGVDLTDDGVRHLAYATALRVLSLRDSQITDSGLRDLEGLKRLEQLNVEGTRVSLDGVMRFQRMRPECFVIY